MWIKRRMIESEAAKGTTGTRITHLKSHKNCLSVTRKRKTNGDKVKRQFLIPRESALGWLDL